MDTFDNMYSVISDFFNTPAVPNIPIKTSPNLAHLNPPEPLDHYSTLWECLSRNPRNSSIPNRSGFPEIALLA